jgi:phosphoribosylamine--glycine ligase
LAEEGIVYQGVLYVGLMLTEEGPYVLEFNARLGDPETQAVLPRLKTDWIDLMESVLEHRLDQLQLQWRDEVAVSVVMASSGYPGDHQSGEEIFGLDQINDPDLMLFHAGTKNMGNRLLTQGGRVLSITALGKDRHEARDRVYRAVGQVSFRGMQYRKDIGK